MRQVLFRQSHQREAGKIICGRVADTCMHVYVQKKLFSQEPFTQFYFALIRFAGGPNYLSLIEAIKCSPQAHGKIFVYNNNGLTAITLLDEVFSDTKLSPVGVTKGIIKMTPFAPGDIMSWLWNPRNNCLIKCILE